MKLTGEKIRIRVRPTKNNCIENVEVMSKKSQIDNDLLPMELDESPFLTDKEIIDESIFIKTNKTIKTIKKTIKKKERTIGSK